MHLCFIADANSIHTRRWIVPLKDRGYQISLISFKAIEAESEWASAYDLTAINNTSVVRFLIWSQYLRTLLKELQPDILHTLQISGAGWLGYLSGFHPFIASAWGSDILLVHERSLPHRTLTGRVLTRCDMLTVPSILMYERAVELGISEDRLKMIPWGVETDILQSRLFDPDETRKRYGIKPDQKVLLCPRGINRIYNIDIAIRAFHSVVKNEPAARLAIILKSVDDDYYRELQKLTHELELDEFIFWLPQQQSLEDMASLYQISDILISIPSSEGYGFTVYEALASSCPTLITDLPVFKGVLINEVHTLKVPVRDVGATSQCILRLLGDQDLRLKICGNGLNLSANDTVENRVKLAEEIYQSLG